MVKDKFFAIDLFAGCGGLSEGFKQAGFDVIAQVEMNKWAIETLRTRQLYYGLKELNKIHMYHEYVTGRIEREKILKKFKKLEKIISFRAIDIAFKPGNFESIFKKIDLSIQFHKVSKVNVLLGGPPCQSFSLVGRSRDPFRMENDERHTLYKYYLKILEYLKPDFFVFENVPGLFTAKTNSGNTFEKLLYDLSTLNPSYKIIPNLDNLHSKPHEYLLNSVDFGIPQRRKRIILIGFREDIEYINPDVKNIFNLIKKYSIKNRENGCFTVDDAIGDLPILKPGEGNDEWYDYYSSSILKPYQIEMRKDSYGVLNHKARNHMRSDIERYKFFIEYHKNGNGLATLKNLKEKRPDLLPNHKHLDKFLDRFKVQWWTHPSSTIMAHISKDGHYYIHPGIHQCRSFTVREAARCQSFPDNFKFEGPRTEQFKQVGNAVPPLLAKVIGTFIKDELQKIYE
ncbi:MAG: DNA cytosine methyltransferase [Kosmotogaceae bacterium]